MSFFDDASLAFLPSGGAGKDGKAYSIKPTDGSGDFTFSRGSNLAATRVGPTGLIEKGRENLLLQSNQFDTTWSKTLSSVIGNQSGYNGSNDAWKMISGASGTYSIVSQNYSGSGVHTLSLYAKAAEWNYIALFINGSAGASKGAIFDLTTGELTNTIFGSPISYSSNSIGDGWWRLSVTLTGTITGANIYLCEVGTSHTSNNNDGSSGIYIQDAQLEIGLAATDYIESGATTGKAGLLEDEPRFDYSGGATCPSLLLEPSRSNVLPYSEYFSASDWINNGVTITDNAAISPEGKTNAALLTGVSGGFGIVKFSTWTATNKVASCFAKSGTGNIFKIANVSAANRYVLFDLSDGTISEESTGWTGSIEDFGNGWYRCTAISNNETGTFSLGTTAASDSVYIYGAQLEAGSYPTSYIPNHSGTGSVTRGLDVISKDLTSVINNNQMTMFVDVKSLTSITTIIAADGFGDLRWYHQAGNRFRFYKIDDADWLTNSFVVNDGDKIALTLTDTQAKLFVNGAQVGTTFTLTTSFQNFSNLNYNVGSSKNEWNQLLFFSTPLSDADCITLTT